jgi:ArsR family transcriptional regulator
MNNLTKRVQILRALAHPVRIQILKELQKEIKCVSDLEKALTLKQSTVSQHLSILRKLNLIDYYVSGKERCYFITDSFVLEILKLLEKKNLKPLKLPKCCPITKRRIE